MQRCHRDDLYDASREELQILSKELGSDEEHASQEDDQFLQFKSGSWCSRCNDLVELHGEGMLFWYILKWLLPGLLMFVSFLFQNFLLHVATYFYVQWMFRLERDIRDTDNPLEKTATGDNLSTVIGEGSLHDISASLLGYHPIPMTVLDMVSISLPICWLALVVYKLNLHLFTKCCFSGSLLAIGKGVFAIITIVPDSIGWKACKARLGEEGIKWFEDRSNMNFNEGVTQSLRDLLHLEIYGLDEARGKHVRFCADMVYSGHTYFVALFGLGIYDAIRWYTRGWPHRHIIRAVAGFFLLAVVLLDMVLILVNRFHYTLDVLLAVIMTGFVYTNVGVARSIGYWANEMWVDTGKRETMKKTAGAFFGGEILMPPCCFPFCLMKGRYYVFKEDEEFTMMKAMHNYGLNTWASEPEEYDTYVTKVLTFHSTASDQNPCKLLPDEYKVLERYVSRLRDKNMMGEARTPMSPENLMREHLKGSEILSRGAALLREQTHGI